MKKNLLTVILIFSVLSLIGQTDIQMSQHMLNRTTYNPASTGASRYVNIYGHWRDQWQGFGDAAPHTIFLTAHSYFNELKSGFGIIALKDQIGFERSMMFKIAYAYHVHLTSNSYISLGLNGGLLNRHIDWDKSTIPELTGIESRWTADFDFGIEYNVERFTAGLSLTHLSKTAERATYGDMGHHYYGYLKYKFPISFDLEIVPSVFAQNSKKSTHMEINTLLYYRSKAWIGGSYRMDDKFESESVVGIAGIDISNKFRLSYSFDYNIGKTGKKNAHANNTHEIMLGIRLSRPQHIYAKTPRFFE
jgi:type IX secretion system PorP/SprF family membrane protein